MDLSNYFNQIKIICTQLYGFKYSYLILTICKQLSLYIALSNYSYLISINYTQ